MRNRPRSISRTAPAATRSRSRCRRLRSRTVASRQAGGPAPRHQTRLGRSVDPGAPDHPKPRHGGGRTRLARHRPCPGRRGKISYVQIGMLGPFEVRTDDGVVADVPGARLRALLVALALEPGHVVPKATLVDWIWGEHPPPGAANALQRLVSRLRKALPDGSIEGQPDGYRLRVEPDAVDAVRFERLVIQARTDADPLRVRLLRE